MIEFARIYKKRTKKRSELVNFGRLTFTSLRDFHSVIVTVIL